MNRKKTKQLYNILLVPFTIAVLATVMLYITTFRSSVKNPENTEASSTVLVQDNFNRTLSDGWGRAETGGTYSRDSKDASVRVENGYGAIAIPYLRSYATVSLDTIAVKDYTGYFNFRLNKLPSQGAMTISTQIRRVSANLFYKLTVSVNSSGQGTFSLTRVTSQGEVPISVDTIQSIPVMKGQNWYRVRYQVTGHSPTGIQAKLWNVGEGLAEPTGWQVNATDSFSQLETAGGVGFALRYLESSRDELLRVDFDNFSIVSNSSASSPVPSPVSTNSPAPNRTAQPSSVPTRAPTSSPVSTTGSKLVVVASGTHALNEYPLLIITLNGQQIGSTRVSNTLTSYPFNSSRKILSGDKVRVYFVNDHSDSSGDRNVRIDYISVDGNVYQTESSAVYSEGSWDSSTGCTGGYKQSEYLHCGNYMRTGNVTAITDTSKGYFEYTVGTSGSISTPTPVKTPVPPSPVSTPITQTGSCTPYYSANSPWNSRIGSAPRYQQTSLFYRNGNSSQPLEAFYINGTLLKLYSDNTQYSYPIYNVNSRTAKQKVYLKGVYSEVLDTNNDGKEDVTKRHRAGTAIVDLPMPPSVEASRGTDGQVVVVNTDTGEEWGFWQVKLENGRYYATNGYYYKVTYTGYPPSSFTNSEARFLSRGAGVPYLTGVVRPCEIIQGKINHALAFAYPKPHSDFVYPATKSDGCPVGRSDVGTCRSYDLPEGSRLQLDPTISDAEIRSWGCTNACFTIAKAMQEYGMILIDISGRAKIASEDNKTAKWSSLPSQYQITEKTTNPIPLNRMKLVEFPYTKNCLVQNGTTVCK